ncbi:MAG: DASS family divalent anion:Na+ symporter [Chlamydiales bacterium]|jgi:DASS family divalent anion:Na+ symporter
MKLFFSILPLLLGGGLWIIPPPDGVTVNAWHLLSIFVATIVGVITKPLPMGAVSIIGLAVVVLTGTLSFTEAFSGFSNEVVWLIVFAFFVARGFIKTGLGSRISYFFMMLLGKRSLGLAYGVVATDLFMAPAIPSTTARTGGVIFPIVMSISKSFGSEPNSPSARKMGSFLTTISIQCSCVSSAMFLTSMAANPLIAELAKDAGVSISWCDWALASIVPGLISLILLPLLIYKIYPPEITETPDAANFSRKKLQEMGSVKREEGIMICAFVLLLSLWIFGPSISINAAVTALIGLALLLLTNVLNWDDILNEKGAWDTLIWFAVLLMMASNLNKLGLTDWFSQWIVQAIQGYSWITAFGILSIVYFYSHYFFASNLAHVGAMYSSFLVVAIALGTPPTLAALVLAFFSSLFGGITHYACGPAAILFGSGYVPVDKWWKVGAACSVLNLVVWLGVGSIWWKFLGIW